VKEPLWIEERVVIAIHARLLELYGGAPGLRDEGLLRSALARPRQLFAYGKAPKLIEMTAAYTAGIVRNHPFVDGNKRTGFVVGILFLETNGCRFTAPEEDATRAVLDLAAGLLDEAGFVSWLSNHVKRIRKKR
jgi:death-on-curing protein